MADKKISALTAIAASALDPGADVLPVVDTSASETKKATVGALVTSVTGQTSVKSFGATGDGTTDDTAAIQAAIDSFASAGTLYFPDGSYKITDTITAYQGRVSMVFGPAARLLFAGTANRVALDIGGTAIYDGAVFDGIAVVNSTSHSYDSESFVGVRFQRISRSYIRIRLIQGFTINLQLWGSHTDGVGYNTFVIGNLVLAKVMLDINSRIADGWINENLFIGGRYGNYSDYGTARASYGVRFRAESGAYRNNNANVWIKPCFEMRDSDAAVDRIPIYIDNAGRYNSFENIRVETGRGPVLYASGANSALGNRVSVTYFGGGNVTLLPTETGAAAYGNEVSTLYQVAPNPRAVWHSGELVTKAFGTTTANIAVKGCFMQASSSSTHAYTAAGAIFRDCVSLTSSQGIGVFVDTTQYKTLIVQTNTLRSRTGRIGVVCYNSSGTLLDSGGANHPYANGTSVSGASSFGYIYRVGADGTNRAVFRVHADVASVKVVIAGGTNPADLVSFTVTGIGGTLDQHALNVYAGVGEDADHWYAGADPDGARNGGYAAKGTMVWNSAAASGAPMGWVCTTAGHNAKAWATSTAYVVGQMVTNDTTRAYVCVTAGTSAGSGGPTGTGTAIADNTAVWDYVGPCAAFTAAANIA